MESLRENASIETQIENDAIKNKYNEKWKIDLKLHFQINFQIWAN